MEVGELPVRHEGDREFPGRAAAPEALACLVQLGDECRHARPVHREPGVPVGNAQGSGLAPHALASSTGFSLAA